MGEARKTKLDMNQSVYTNRIALTVALGGFLMGFDASVISGVNKFVQIQFNLSDLQLGFSVSSLTIVAALAMMFEIFFPSLLTTQRECLSSHRWAQGFTATFLTA